MEKHPCDVLKEAYLQRALPATMAKFKHKWLTTTSEDARSRWLKILRPGDCDDFSAPEAFLNKHGMSFVYPLSLYGYYIGFAIRAVATKDMRSFVRYPYSACYSSFASNVADLPQGGVTTILVEGYADVEATASISNRIIVMLDGDEAGQTGFKTLKKQFESIGKKVSQIAIPPLKYKDPETGEEKTVKDPDDWCRYHNDSFTSIVRRAV